MAEQGDNKLQTAIDRLLPAWREALALREREAAGGVKFGPSVTSRMNLSAALVPSFEAWYGAPLDRSMGVGSVVSGRSALRADAFCWHALDRAAAQGPASGVTWLKKVLGTKSAAGRIYAEVSGLVATESGNLCQGFDIRPAPDVKDDPFEDPRLSFMPEVGAVVSLAVPPSPFIAPMGGSNLAEVSALNERLHDLVTALALLGGAPRVAMHWFEYDDPDLNLLITRQRIYPFRTGSRFHRPNLDIAAASALLTQYGQLGGPTKRSIDLALDRLVSARIHLWPGDKALDGAIGLEALFGDTQGEEIGYRIRLRAALFMEDDPGRRATLRAMVGKFYGIRSKVAHGRVSSSAAGKGDDDAVISAGLDLVQRAAVKVCQRGAIPDWGDFEISSKPPEPKGSP
ncbi:MAG: hypothetical protein JHD15_15860 [Phenylobacterium sp.]|uniref:HEPN domain-containing protein n=1 Tax=Phenylobacterium sp. TaxID=1871053 RepID=UPI001A23D1B6|nr:HEPN domain-containing protein [Phenylobacterium sp.]MBJ7411822.1 hypothetical protein [Phenylobacterium sp.]